MTGSALGLTIAYWLHMLATVVWVGGLAALSIFVLPAARKSLDGAAYAAFLAELQRRLDPLAWFSLLVLGGTGLFQMSANPHYQGFLTIANTWAYAILIKHLLFLGMAGISAYLTWVVLPGLRRISLQRALADQGKALAAPPEEALSRQETRLLRLNLLLGILVLALTALARAS